MELWNVIGKVFGSSSSTPPMARRQHRRSDPNAYSTNIADVRGRGGATSTSNGKQLHGIVTSALWAIARTPAFVHAIERVETSFGEKQLTSVLQALCDSRVLNDRAALLEATEQAEAFLVASRMSLYDSMDPMDAIRGILGLCGDSQDVIEEVMRTTYRKTKVCTFGGCHFLREEGLWYEESLMCTRETAQQTVDVRAAPTSGAKLCPICLKRTAAEKFALESPPRYCLVAVWKPLRAESKAVQENFTLRSRFSQEFSFKSSVVIANHQSKIVCVFREGQNYFRVEGHEIKEVSATDWLKIKPLLAIFTRQTSSDTGGGGRNGRRRRGGDPRRSCERYAAASLAGKASPSEVIEVKDDDDGNSCGSYGDDFVGSRPHPVGESVGIRPQLGENIGSAHVELRGRSLRRRPPGALFSRERCESRGAEGAVEPADAGSTNVERSGTRLEGAQAGTVVLDVYSKQSDVEPKYCRTNRERSRESISDRPRRHSLPQSSDDPWLRHGGSWGARGGYEADADSRVRNTCATSKIFSAPRSWRDLKDTRSHADPAPGNDESKIEEFDDVQLVSGEILSGNAAVVVPSSSQKTSRGALNGVNTADERLMHCHNRAGAVAVESAYGRECVAPMTRGDVLVDSLVDAINVSAELRSRRIDDWPKAVASSSWQDHPNVQSPSTNHVVHSFDGESSPAISQADVSGSRLSCVGMSFMGQTRLPTTGSPLHHKHHSATQMEDYQARTSEEHDVSRKRDDATSGGGGGCDGSRASSPAEGGGNIALDEVTTLSSLRAGENAKWKDTPEGGGKERDAEWIRSGSDALEGVSGAPIRRSKRRKGGAASGVNRSNDGERAMEDLTGPERPEEEAADGGVRAAWASSKGSRKNKIDEPTLTMIRGINLRQDHFERIVDSDGWLTSQIIDVRVKQLQEEFSENLYYDSSFFGFLCPTIEQVRTVKVLGVPARKRGDFIVDYARVQGWTKRSRLPPGKSSIFEMRKLFIPINQGNVHWVLVVVEMEGAGGNVGDASSGDGSAGTRGESRFKVTFFDSFGRNGTSYVEAVQQYLVSELSIRDKFRQGTFILEPRPPRNAPRQHNSSDCGVLMLHVMEELSTGSVSKLNTLTQEEIVSLRYKLFGKIRE